MNRWEKLGDKLESLKKNLPKKLVDDAEFCPICDGYGNIVTPEGAKPCECLKKDMDWVAQFRLARIPRKYIKKSLNSYQVNTDQQKKHVERAQSFVKNYSPTNNRGLYISGINGIGKTHLGIGVLKELIKKGHNAIFYNTTDLLDDIKSGFNDPLNRQFGSPLVDQLQEVEILLLDDLGPQKMTDYVFDRLYALINGLYEKEKTLIVTSHFGIEELEQRLNYAICSRLYELCGSPFEMAGGSDFRKFNQVAKPLTRRKK